MEYLVTMTTHVPAGTPAGTVDGVRAREAAHTRELAAQGHVLRLWRPPLAPGEWRTLGLFAAVDAAELEGVLAGMPLRVWRSDEVKELSRHPNDPVPSVSGDPAPADGGTPAAGPAAAEFLVTFAPAVPAGTPAKDVADATAREALRAGELAARGHLIRLWQLPAEQGVSSALGLYRAADAAEMQAIVAALPMYPYLRTETTPLTPHPSDPAAPGSRSLRVSYSSPVDLAEALRQASAAHGRHEKEIGHADPNWPDWYAAWMVADRTGGHVTPDRPERVAP
jgi:muconolactone delta-isomerase